MKHRTLLVALALGAASCADPLPSDPAGPGLVSLGIGAIAPPTGMLVGPNVVVEQVVVTLSRVVNDITQTVATRTVPFGVDQAGVNLSFTLFLSGPEDLYLDIDYQTATGQTLFFASQLVRAVPGAAVTPMGALQPYYIGPGSNVAFLFITPTDTSVTAGDSLGYTIAALDSFQQPVPSFYVTWGTSDARTPINAGGLVRTPDLTQIIDIVATTPNGTGAQTSLTILGSAGLGLRPDSVEKQPGGSQQFVVSVGGLRTSQFVWSVNGVDGGSTNTGAVDSLGLYTAPATVPAAGKVTVCARDVTRPGTQGCAVVVLNAVPSAGADIVVFNDMNAFDSIAMKDGGNRRMAKNMVSFTTGGVRNGGTVVWFDRGRNSPCFSNGECGDQSHQILDSVVTAQGFSILRRDFYTPITTIPSDVKTIFLWNPTITFDTTEVNELKRFAGQGGRIVFIGEYDVFYGQVGLAVENQLLADLGAQLTNAGAAIDCVNTSGAYPRLPAASLRPHQVTQGMSGVTVACASEVIPGPNDVPIIFDATNTIPLAGVAKINTTPLPAPPAPMRAGVRIGPPSPGRGVTGRGP